MKKTAIYITAFSIMLQSALSTGAVAAHETVGRTYDIAEKDAVDDIEDAARKVDWNKIMREEGKKRLKEYQPKDISRLPRAPESKKYLVDMTYTLEMDIPDGKGGILYPKGYTFNPLEYVPAYTGLLVIIDPTDKDQLDWFVNSDYAEDFRVKLLITDGAYGPLLTQLNRQVYYLNNVVADRLQITAVPSVVQQNGLYMEVEQIDVAQRSVSQNN